MPEINKKKQSRIESGESLKGDIQFENELWDAAVKLRGNVAPAEYKHYVLPLLFLRYLSLQYERRKQELSNLVHRENSEYYTDDPEIAGDIIADPDEYRKTGTFVIPTQASWAYLVEHGWDDDIKIKINRAMELLENEYPELPVKKRHFYIINTISISSNIMTLR